MEIPTTVITINITININIIIIFRRPPPSRPSSSPSPLPRTPWWWIHRCHRNRVSLFSWEVVTKKKILYFWELHKLGGSPLSKIVEFLFSTATVPNVIINHTVKLCIEIIVLLTSVLCEEKRHSPSKDGMGRMPKMSKIILFLITRTSLV